MSNQRVLPVKVAIWSELVDRRPVAARVADVDLLVLRIDDTPRVLEGRCPHRAGRLVGGRLEGDLLICPFHGWDFDCRSGKSVGVEGESIYSFDAWLDKDGVFVDEDVTCPPKDDPRKK
ncbi:MAG TPA: Rieske (2Fe-2S) protein [Pseudomonadota bacterium]|nr:Rieske (2Fe-2S) protein [Pseudomonadota bacterium]